ncbi:DinB superfamily [Sphingobacterium spiritivorum]|uniref:DinB superfamily n=1 Tax=Sphingobacterium spiritivorum TaxID=258 RepID=A0A380CQJ0_SPHSI|nr:DinB family protein [Sphingobacterium spiritivorum]SUJ25681.1 DinB superfamily [Sphingobacterium spiritivorum]
MKKATEPEVWMRGPVAGVPGLLQPVAHALLQAQQDITDAVKGIDEQSLWQRPSGVASIGFHLQHISGVIDRMFTYAQDRPLSEQQLSYLAKEGLVDPTVTVESLLLQLEIQLQSAISQLCSTDTDQLTAIRYLGRKRIPTTLTGLLFHAAEHTQRHTGQLLVTARVLICPPF